MIIIIPELTSCLVRSTLEISRQVPTNWWETVTRIELQLSWGGIPNSHPWLPPSRSIRSPFGTTQEPTSRVRSAPALSGITLLPGRSGLLNHLPLDSRLRLPSEVHFILANSRPELSYSDSWSSTRAWPAKREAFIQHEQERLQESVLNRHTQG
jgi:hypothetical protein